MTTETVLHVGGLQIQVVRKDIKNLHLAVYPPAADVRVAAPAHMDDDAIRLAVVDRLPWVRRQQRELLAQPRQSKREMVNGETHYAWGRRYRLVVVEDAEARPGVVTRGVASLRLTVRPGADRDARERVLTDWYRAELKREVAKRIAGHADNLGIEVPEWRVRRMRTKWGTCNTAAGRIWLNLELAKKSPRCLDYVLLHELAHLREPGHTAGFQELLESVLPDWRAHRDELYRLPLGYEDWPSGRS